MTFKIKNRIISNKTKPYIIAEMSSNHLGNIKNAKEIIKMAKMSGASAVKLQTFHPEDITLNSNSNIFKIKNGLWKDQTYFNLYKKIYMPMTKQVALFKYAKKIGITIFSSPLSIRNVDFLESMKVPAYKIPSFEANDFNLLNKCIKTGKPLIISTGTSYSYEIDEIIIPSIPKYEEKELKSVNRSGAADELEKDANKDKLKSLKPILKKMKD